MPKQLKNSIKTYVRMDTLILLQKSFEFGDTGNKKNSINNKIEHIIEQHWQLNPLYVDCENNSNGKSTTVMVQSKRIYNISSKIPHLIQETFKLN